MSQTQWVRGARRGKKRLSGEEFIWFLIAERIGCSVDEVKEKTSATQFLMWQKRIEDEPNEFNPLFWYMAQVAEQVYLLRYVVMNMFAKKAIAPQAILKDFILKFKATAGDEKPTEEQLGEKAESSKKSWLTGLGLDKDGKVIGKIVTRKPPPVPVPDRGRRTFGFGRRGQRGT